jgi:large subunit ribosomal protein L13
MLTVSAKPAEVKHHWHLVDADGMALGRLASRVARVLQGKHRPDWTAHVDCGDFVVVINCSKIRLSGKKAEVKEYLRYTGYPGGLRAIPYKAQLEAHPERVIQTAVRRMLPKSKLGKAMLTKLKTFPGAEHNHQAQRHRPLVLS